MLSDQQAAKKLRFVPPELLALGVEQDMWVAWLALIETQLREHYAFYGKPGRECAYWCCPCLCVQTCWCMANPATHRMIARMADAGDYTEKLINEQLRVVLYAAAEGTKAHRLRDEAHFAWVGGICVFLPHGASSRPILRLRTASIEGRRLPSERPEELSVLGVSPTQWTHWVGLLEKERRAHLFHRCPWLGPLYFCCPLGPVQWCLCLLNPCTWYHGSRVTHARAHAEDAINRELGPLGGYFRYGPDSTAQFRKGIPQKTLGIKKKRGGLGRTIEIAGAASGVSLLQNVGGQASARAMHVDEESAPVGQIKL